MVQFISSALRFLLYLTIGLLGGFLGFVLAGAGGERGVVRFVFSVPIRLIGITIAAVLVANLVKKDNRLFENAVCMVATFLTPCLLNFVFFKATY